MTERGFYSLIQFVPKPGRAEAANVGVVLVCPQSGSIRVQMAPSNAGPKRRFAASEIDDVRLTYAKSSISRRLMDELGRQPTLEALQVARGLEGNALVLTEPRAVRVDDVEQAVRNLYDELVFVQEVTKIRTRAPDVAHMIRNLQQRNVPIELPKEVLVPVTGEQLKVAFAYTNGVHNLVQAQGFSSSRGSAIQHAKQVGAQGHLLHTHSGEKKDRLVVVARFGNSDHESTVTQMLEDLHVRVIPERSIEALQEEIALTAHPR